MDRVQDDLCDLCYHFLLILKELKETGEISEVEYEMHVKLKKLFIHQEKNKLST